MLELFQYAFMQKALLGGLGIALCCGLIGPFVVLRRLSLLGDGLAHLSFGGIALGLLLGINPLLAALVSAVLGSFWIQHLMRKNVYGESAIALVLSLGVGVGVVVLGAVHGFSVNLYSYLIGSILSLTTWDLVAVFSLCIVVSGFMYFCYQDMFFLTFLEDLARFSRQGTQRVNVIFTVLTALVVVLAIRAVGILLVSALLVIPTLIAFELARSFKQTVFYAVLASVIATLAGIILAYIFDLPPSGAIVLLLLAGFLIVRVTKVAVKKMQVQ